jgi:PAS domain S-box-containing protein
MEINCLLNSLFLVQAYSLTKEIFLIYNLIFSIVMFFYYITFYFYYDSDISFLAGIFHSLYAWTSIFGIIFVYVNVKEKGIIYIITCLIVCFCYRSLKNKIDKEIFYNNNPKKLRNTYHLLFFLKYVTNKIIKVDQNTENKAFIYGIIQVLCEEANNYIENGTFDKEIHLPLDEKWKDLYKNKMDENFKKNFIVILFNYLIFNKDESPDINFNISLYYLMIIQNYCQSMYYYQKLVHMKLNIKERFTLKRLKIKISTVLLQNLSPSDEQIATIENANISLYYKYDDLSQNFMDEITNDIELSLDFWKTYKKYAKDQSFNINFNKVFKLTDKIRTSKKNIEKMWNNLLKIYSGVNEYFNLYNEYIEQINDDDLKKRDLDSLKKKKDYFNDHLNSNYYSTIFNKDTGIIIANGDIGSEGIIKHCNKRIEKIFNYNISDLKETNITVLMPKLLEKQHSKYIERYFREGKKKYIETKELKTYAKDKNNSIMQIKLGLKLLPILNLNVFFAGLIIKENNDDIILIDKDFNIQGMSSKLTKILNIENIFLFQDNDIPFYVICKKFVNFYNIFLKPKKNTTNELDKKIKTLLCEEISNAKGVEGKEPLNAKNQKNDDNDFNVEINENVELEYEIKIPQFLIDYSEKTKNKANKNFFGNDEEKTNFNQNEDEEKKEE